jgi:type IV pilus assembly protein PilQ
MRRIGTLAALSAALLTAGAGAARAAHTHTPSASAFPAQATGAVTGISVVPGDGRAEVVIALSGFSKVTDFTIDNPERIVLDVSGARVGGMGRAYDRVRRGGILNIRVGQYQADVVRIVLDLAAPARYSVTRGEQAVRISVSTGESFAAWHSQEASVLAVSPVAQVTTVSSAGDVAADPAAEAPARIDAMLAAAAELAPPAPPPPPAPLFSVQSQQSRITVTYVDADIREVIAGFAERTGRTIVVGKAVTGTVSAEIRDQPWDVALRAILDAQGFAATEDVSGIITVDSYQNILQKQASEPLTTRLINVNYVNAGSLVETVKSLLSRDCPAGAVPAEGQAAAPGGASCLQRGNVVADSGTNSLLITEVSSRLPVLLQYVQQLDVRTPQVALKAKIISVSRTQIEQLGLSYDLGSAASYFNTLLPRSNPASEGSVDDREGRVSLGGEVLAGVANASRRYKNGSALNLLFSTALGKYSLSAFLDALREQQLSDIQAEPSIVTLDNREAKILVGQETPVRVIDAGSAAQIGQPARANVQFKETGIILTVTPHITNNRQIRMSIAAEQSELRIIGGDLGFTIDKRNANTQLLVRDGETAVIGGLTQTQIVKNKSGIPLLSDLPLMGRLFSQTDVREEKRDLLILITPHIIDEGEAIRPPGNTDGSR